ncbi:hypothetical protein AAC387_Pa12g1841 [Persea americana]
MGLGRGSKDDFHISGPTHLKHVDWTRADHRRIVAASLVMGVYVLERDRQEEGEGAAPLAEPWFSSFNFKLVQKLIDIKDESIYGAIYNFESPSHHLPLEAPEYVIAFRGTLLKKESVLEDLKLDFHILHQRFHKRKRTGRATEAVRRVVFPEDNPGPMLNVWLAGHSLGSSLAIQAGKNIAAENDIFLKTFLFNPPFPSLVTKRIVGEGAKEWIEDLNIKFTAKFATLFKSPDQLFEDEANFEKLSRWSPYMFVNEDDWICSRYIRYFNHIETLNETEARHWRLAKMNSIRALLKNACLLYFQTSHFLLSLLHRSLILDHRRSKSGFFIHTENLKKAGCCAHKMGTGKGSGGNDFNISGPTHLRHVVW